MKQTIRIPNLRNVKISDPLFASYIENVSKHLLPYQWEVLNDRLEGVEKSYCIANFKIAAGELEGHHRGVVFCDTDAYKWLETLAYCLENGMGEQLVPVADDLIELIARAQQPDGYLQTYFSIDHPELKWKNLTEGHELYGAGHLIEAAVAYYRATGKPRILEVTCRLADLICELFGEREGQCPGYPGHQEIEIGLIKLSRLTGEKKYAELARHFLNVRGREPNYLLQELAGIGENRIFPEFVDYEAKYAQSHALPVLQRTAEGHTVRAMYMYSAMADIAADFDDEQMKAACCALWDNVTRKRMYITGGIGSSGHLERFTTDYDLPNDRMYCESCASVGLMMFGQRMAALTGQAEYYDVVERALCNTVLGGIAAEGDRYFYVNPLEVWPDNCLPSTSMAHVKPVRQKWFAVACCPSNIARTLASLGQYIYAQDEKSVYINQLLSSSIDTELNGMSVRLELQSQLLQKGQLELKIRKEGAGTLLLRIRIPSYLEDPVFEIDGSQIRPAIENGYAVLAVSRTGEQILRIRAAIRPRWMGANSHVRADVGRLALTYGPYVYCLEQTDNGDHLAGCYADSRAAVEILPPCEGLPGNLPMLGFAGRRLSSGVADDVLYGEPGFRFIDTRFKAIPYCLWCNREPGEMAVWLKAELWGAFRDRDAE